MTVRERMACDGLAEPDDNASVVQRMEWLREHCERLAWELQRASKVIEETSTRGSQDKR